MKVVSFSRLYVPKLSRIALLVQFAISSNKLVLVNGRSNVPTGVEGKLIAELSRLSVDKIFFSLIYQFWNVYFIMYLHSLC